MKKLATLLVVLCFSSLAFSKPVIKESISNGFERQGYESIWLEVQAEELSTANALEWEAYDIAGMSVMGLEVLTVDTGDAITTINAQPIYSDGTSYGSAQTITVGTDLTEFKAPNYKFSIPAQEVTKNASFIFIIAR